MEHNDKIKKAFWITEDMDREIDAHLKLDNCSSRSEFVMNALKFYVGYLNTKNASAFLPEVLSATLTGTLDGFAGRISSLLFKQGVDINLMAQIIAYDTDIDEGTYERLRGKAIRDMKRSNGLSEIGVSDGEARTEERLYQIWESRWVHALHCYP